MSKRRATTNLTDRNWEEEDEPEEAGTFETAGDEELRTRVIKKAKRRTRLEDQEDDKPSAFAGFSFGSSKPLAGFSFKTAPTSGAAATSSFSFKSSAATTTTSDSPSVTRTVPSSAGDPPSFGDTVTASGKPNGAGLAAGDSSATAANEQYSQKLQKLNRSVSSWIQKHVADNPVCDLTPVFGDYKKHLAEIEKFRVSHAPSAPASASNVSPSAPTPGFLFGKSTDSAKAPPDKAKFSFGATSTSSGKKVASLFGAGAPFTFGTKGTGEETRKETEVAQKEDDDSYTPPVAEVRTVQEKDALFSIRCKLFYRKDGSFMDRGVGMLHLKKTGQQLQLLVRADTSLGNVLLNISLPPSLPINRQGKNNVIIMTPINPPPERLCPQCNKKYPHPQESNVCDSGCTPEAMALLIRVKTGPDADSVFEKIKELQGE